VVCPEEDIFAKKDIFTKKLILGTIGVKYESDEYGNWLAIGAGLGFIFGLMLDQIGLGIALGAGIGLVFGLIIPEKEKK